MFGTNYTVADNGASESQILSDSHTMIDFIAKPGEWRDHLHELMKVDARAAHNLARDKPGLEPERLAELYEQRCIERGSVKAPKTQPLASQRAQGVKKRLSSSTPDPDVNDLEAVCVMRGARLAFDIDLLRGGMPKWKVARSGHDTYDAKFGPGPFRNALHSYRESELAVAVDINSKQPDLNAKAAGRSYKRLCLKGELGS